MHANGRPLVQMLWRSLIIGFLARFALLYALLLCPWPGLDRIYGHYFRGLARIVFARDHAQRITIFEPTPEPVLRGLTTQITLANREFKDVNGRQPVRILKMDTRGIAWIPTALLIALVLATPLPFRRLLWALMSGLVLIHAYILVSLGVYIWNESTELSLLELSPFWKSAMDMLEDILIVQLGASFVAPVLIWIGACFRRTDLADRDGLFTRWM